MQFQSLKVKIFNFLIRYPVNFIGKTGPDRIGSKSTGYRTGPDIRSAPISKIFGVSPPRKLQLPLLSDLFLEANLVKITKIFGGFAP